MKKELVFKNEVQLSELEKKIFGDIDFEDPLKDIHEPEWENEPDYEEFEYKGYLCNIRRNRMHAWCGYIGLPKEHPWYDKGYDEIDMDVHGGLTFAQMGKSTMGEMKRDKKLWFIGFDCYHGGDYSPFYEVMIKKFEDNPEAFGTIEEGKLLIRSFKKMRVINASFLGAPTTYKNIEFARNECYKMVDQAMAAMENK